MTNIAQFKIVPGYTILEGKAAPQGIGLLGAKCKNTSVNYLI